VGMVSNPLLVSLFDAIPGPSASERWADLAARLNRIAGRHWTATYLQSAASGSVTATATMQAAAASLAASMDGSPGHLATAVERSVSSAPGNDVDGAYIMGLARACERCGSKFVGTVPWRRFCPSCHPPRL